MIVYVSLVSISVLKMNLCNRYDQQKIVATCVVSVCIHLRILSYLSNSPFNLFLPFFYSFHTFINNLNSFRCRLLSISFHLYFISIVISLPISSLSLSFSYQCLVPSKKFSFKGAKSKTTSRGTFYVI